jgi:hypothetical protein
VVPQPCAQRLPADDARGEVPQGPVDQLDRDAHADARAIAAALETHLAQAEEHAAAHAPAAGRYAQLHGHVAKEMQRSSLVYNRSDKHSAFSEADQGLIRGLEHELLTRADGVLYSSRAFRDSERELTGERAHFLDHGVDTKHFAPRGRTEALAGFDCKRPIIGFFGGLDDYVIDFDLLERLAVERPNYTLVLIGDATLSMERLTRHANVRHLGFKPYAEIPNLGADFDVSIMPWLDNDWIRSCNPIKLKEYLSLGQEVVTTYFPEVEHYLDYVHVARSGDEFLARIDDVVNGAKAKGDRKALLGKATWDDRTQELLQILDGIAAKKGAACAAS